MPSRFEDSVDRLLVRAAAFAVGRPRTTLGITAILAGLSIASAFGMQFHDEVTDLVPASTAQALRRLEEVFGGGNSAFLLVTANRPAADELVALARRLAAELQQHPLVSSVSHGWSELSDKLLSPGLLASALLYASPAELEELRSLLTTEGIQAQVHRQALRLDLPGLGEAEAWVRRDPLELRRFLVARMGQLRGGFRFHPASLEFLSADARAILIRVDGRPRSSEMPGVKELVRAIQAAAGKAVAEATSSSPGLELRTGLTGGYAFAFETEAAVRQDLTWNNVGSALLVLALVAWAYRGFVLVWPSMAALAIGMLLGFGVFSLLQREMVTLAFVSGAALAGLGIDYVIYVTMRTFADPRGPSTAAVCGAVQATGRSIALAALATAAAFFSFPLTGEKFLADVGMLSGVGILACAAAAIVVLPALLAPWARRGDRVPAPLRAGPLEPRDYGASWLAGAALRWPRLVCAVSALSALASAAYLAARPPVLERDLLRMYPDDSAAITTQRAIAETFGGAESPVLLFVEGDTAPAGPAAAAADPEVAAIEAAARLEGPLHALRQAGVLTAWTSPAALVPPAAEQERARELIARAGAAELAGAFRAALEAEGFDPEAFREAEDVFRAALSARELVTPALLRREGMAAEIGKVLGARDGKGFALIAVHPAQQLWRSADQERVFAELERTLAASGVRGDIAGLQVLSAKGASALLGEFLRVSVIASAVVVAVVIVCFRGFIGAMLALLPVVLGTLWMLVTCGLCGIGINFMNVGVLPMVLGTGADIGIHMARQYLDDPEGEVRQLVARTGGSVMLASLTTLAGFGTMVLSTNPGLASVGAMSVLGTLGCLVAALVTVPAVVALRSRRRTA